MIIIINIRIHKYLLASDNMHTHTRNNILSDYTATEIVTSTEVKKKRIVGIKLNSKTTSCNISRLCMANVVLCGIRVRKT